MPNFRSTDDYYEDDFYDDLHEVENNIFSKDAILFYDDYDIDNSMQTWEDDYLEYIKQEEIENSIENYYEREYYLPHFRKDWYEKHDYYLETRLDVRWINHFTCYHRNPERKETHRKIRVHTKRRKAAKHKHNLCYGNEPTTFNTCEIMVCPYAEICEIQLHQEFLLGMVDWLTQVKLYRIS